MGAKYLEVTLVSNTVSTSPEKCISIRQQFQRSDLVVENVCKSNAAVESHFKDIKLGRFDEQQPVRRRKFIAGELTFLLGNIKEF